MLTLGLGLRRLCCLSKCSSSKLLFIQNYDYSSQQESVQDVIASIIRNAKDNDSQLNDSLPKSSKSSPTKRTQQGSSGIIADKKYESERNRNEQKKSAPSSDIASELEIETAEPVVIQRKKAPVANQPLLTRKVMQALRSLTDDEAEALAFIKNVKLSQPLVPEQEEYLERFTSFVQEMNLRNLPAVTRIISATQTDYQKFILEQWKLRMVEELGVQGFEEYQKENFEKGHKLHYAIQQKLLEEPLEVTPNIEGYWKSLQLVLPALEHVYSLEDNVVHPYLHYRGIFDCLAIYRGCACVIDWKTSSKPKPTLRDTYDYPLQMVAYIGALNQSDYLVERGIPQVNSAALVVAYENGDPAHIHFLDATKCQYYWKKWLDKLHQYWLLKSSGAAS